jgi:hypothetical protein
MFVDMSGRVKLISGGRVAFELDVMEMFPLETTSKERYWTVVPLIQFRTNVTDEALLSPRVQLNIELNTIPPST